MTHSPAILVVENRRAVLRSILSVCHKHGLPAQGVRSANEALSALTQRPMPIVMCGWRLPDMHGSKLMETVKARWPHTAIVALLWDRDAADNQRRECPAADEYLVEPVSGEAVTGCVFGTAIKQVGKM